FCYLSTVFFQPGPGWTNWFVWGGVFNPLAGSLFLVGLLELLRLKKNLLAQWLMAALLLSLLPGFAAKDVEIYRIITLFPLMAIVGAFGAMALLRDSPRKWRTLGLSLLLLASSGLDLYHLYGPYHEVFGVPNPQWALQKSEPFYRAFQILDENFKPQGPGAVLTDLWAHSSDESLTLATYPFNTVRNPRLSPPDAKWVAVLTDPNEKPFLARRFPHGKWFWLGTLKANDPDGLMMGVIPLEDSNREALSHWIEADKELQPVTSFVMNRAPWASKQGAIDLLEAAYPSVQGDPFLESSYWEKTYRMEETDDHPQAMLKALQEGLKRGYPSAHLYNEEGILLEGLNRIPEARSAFEQA
ncbi:MAG TPA: hypothetical protein VK859_11280, partial [bacterium]|nr:hypothetical protein [bacterium]